uniref:Uncharacterized protein n=1 Tax=Oryza sativa subsp. japonica TaxID=39947 RepID=Q5KQC5_ORYSJ|nr:hypothetical protein [Oryza sativa Japonica Group]
MYRWREYELFRPSLLTRENDTVAEFDVDLTIGMDQGGGQRCWAHLDGAAIELNRYEDQPRSPIRLSLHPARKRAAAAPSPQVSGDTLYSSSRAAVPSPVWLATGLNIAAVRRDGGGLRQTSTRQLNGSTATVLVVSTLLDPHGATRSIHRLDANRCIELIFFPCVHLKGVYCRTGNNGLNHRYRLCGAD